MEADLAYHRKMITGFLADSKILPAEQDAIRGRLAKHVHADGRIMAGCLMDIFLDDRLKADFVAAWEAAPGKFLAMVGSDVTT